MARVGPRGSCVSVCAQMCEWVPAAHRKPGQEGLAPARPSVFCAHLPVLGEEERMALTPNFRNVGSLAGEAAV